MEKSIYRIIDANFNRAREAARMMEEYVRFSLNRPAFSSRAKQIRHTLCGCIEKLDTLKLLCSRDTSGDVGRTVKVDAQLQRRSLDDCFIAAAKRAGEALRVLAECIQSIDPAAAATMEHLRFDVYALEKDVSLASDAKQKFASVRLYVLVNTGPDTPDTDVLEFTRQCALGDADCLQLRAKGITDSRFLNLAGNFTQICHEHSVLSIINDRADIAICSGADGVHLGQEDIPVSSAKNLAPRPLIVGASTHNTEELNQAIESGYDYIAIGPAFASSTKPDVKVAGIGYIKEALQTLEQANLAHAAIGGITPSNIQELFSLGIRTVAVSASISSSDPGSDCKVLKTLLLNHN